MIGCKMFGHIKFATETQEILTGHTEQGKTDSSSRDENLVLVMLFKKKKRRFRAHPFLTSSTSS